MTPLELSDLPVASVAVDGDLMLLRKGLTDYQINVTAIRAINLSVYPSLASAVGNDIMLIQRTSSTYSIRFDQVGLLKGARIWFYLGSAPSGWAIVPNTGDRLLAVTSGSGVNRYNNASAGTQSGSWQQEGVGGGNPGGGLNINQIPNHYHQVNASSDNTSSNVNFCRSGKSDHNIGTFSSSGVIGSTNDLSTNACLPHNHGNSWRPSANIGIICEKSS